MNDLPGVSVLVPTFARTGLLVEVIESLMRQDYHGPLELVVLNDNPEQRLTMDRESRDIVVRIINARDTFRRFGLKRQALVEEAAYDLQCWWDDDDIYLPGFISALIAKRVDGDPATRLHRMLQWNGERLRVVASTIQHTAMVSRAAVNALGGIPDLPAGKADVAFWDNAYRHGFFNGERHHLPDGHLLAIHRAEPYRAHAGRLEQGSHTEKEHRAQLLRDAPTGEVELIPSWSRDWVGMADDFQQASKCVTAEL